MILQAFIDDSAKGDPNLFVLAGYIATAEAWATFSDDWQRLLDGETKYLKRKRFKMSERRGRLDRERNSRYYRVIEEHVYAALSFSIPTALMRRVVDEMFPETFIDARMLKNPFHYAFTSLIGTFAKNQHVIYIHSPVDFVFDDMLHDKAACIEGWETFKRAADPKSRKLMGDLPGFKKDDDVLPLQAADLYAWWVRHWQRNGVIYAPLDDQQFDWERKKEIHSFHVAPTEADIRRRYEIIRARAEARGRLPPRLKPTSFASGEGSSGAMPS